MFGEREVTAKSMLTTTPEQKAEDALYTTTMVVKIERRESFFSESKEGNQKNVDLGLHLFFLLLILRP